MKCWIVLAWGSTPAGPAPGAPPWLFPRESDAAAYAAQLHAGGTPAVTHAWTANVHEWQGRTLICHPQLPAPALSDAAASAPPASTENGTTQNGADKGPLPPPPEA